MAFTPSEPFTRWLLASLDDPEVVNKIASVLERRQRQPQAHVLTGARAVLEHRLRGMRNTVQPPKEPDHIQLWNSLTHAQKADILEAVQADMVSDEIPQFLNRATPSTNGHDNTVYEKRSLKRSVTSVNVLPEECGWMELRDATKLAGNRKKDENYIRHHVPEGNIRAVVLKGGNIRDIGAGGGQLMLDEESLRAQLTFRAGHQAHKPTQKPKQTRKTATRKRAQR